IDLLKRAAEQFLIRLLPDDKAKVGAFNDKIQMGAHFSNNRDQLVSEVRDLDYGNGTRLWDAVGASLDELKNLDGRRVILVFTDGDDTASKTSLGRVIERGRSDEVMIYAIGLESRYFDGVRMVRSKPDSGLRKIGDETGGGGAERRHRGVRRTYMKIVATITIARSAPTTHSADAEKLHSRISVYLLYARLDEATLAKV